MKYIRHPMHSRAPRHDVKDEKHKHTKYNSMHTTCDKFTKYVESVGGTCRACSPYDAARRLGVWPSGHQFPEFSVKSFNSDPLMKATQTLHKLVLTHARLILQSSNPNHCVKLLSAWLARTQTHTCIHTRSCTTHRQGITKFSQLRHNFRPLYFSVQQNTKPWPNLLNADVTVCHAHALTRTGALRSDSQGIKGN